MCSTRRSYLGPYQNSRPICKICTRTRTFAQEPLNNRDIFPAKAAALDTSDIMHRSSGPPGIERFFLPEKDWSVNTLQLVIEGERAYKKERQSVLEKVTS